MPSPDKAQEPNAETSLIERVARAMWNASHDGEWPQDADGPEIWRADARAAITAMREPTEAMMRASLGPIHEAFQAGGQRTDPDGKTPWYRGYQAMIDAALEK